MISFRITLGSGSFRENVGNDRSGDWWTQAIKDLELAEHCLSISRHEWACFMAHQSAEKAVKALYFSSGEPTSGNVIVRLINELPFSTVIDSELVEEARVLETYYLASRYPDSHVEGSPFQMYGSLQSREAVLFARNIFEGVSNGCPALSDPST